MRFALRVVRREEHGRALEELKRTCLHSVLQVPIASVIFHKQFRDFPFLLLFFVVTVTPHFLHGDLRGVRRDYISRGIVDVCLFIIDEVEDSFLLGNLQLLERHP